MGKHEKPAVPLYERDFHAWTQEQAEKLRARAYNDIDWENVAEEIDSLGRSDKREIRNRLEVLLRHLLKWEFQPEKRKSGWHSTIVEQRSQLHYLIDESPSLGKFPQSQLQSMYQLARIKAQNETGLPLSTFPERSPYSISQVLAEQFLPGAPLVRDEGYFD
jgi:hypothetical protein